MTKETQIAIDAAKRLGFVPPDGPEFRANPWSGAKHKLPPEACLLYDFITVKTATCGIEYTRLEWDLARFGFRELWPKEYMDLLD